MEKHSKYETMKKKKNQIYKNKFAKFKKIYLNLIIIHLIINRLCLCKVFNEENLLSFTVFFRKTKLI
jgi:hypothetical protein